MAGDDHRAIDHVRHPFAFEWTEGDVATLEEAVASYLDSVRELLGVSTDLLAVLRSKDGSGFRWVGAPWSPWRGDRSVLNPERSFRLGRQGSEASTLVLIAGNCIVDKGRELHLGGGVGLAVHVLVGPVPGAPAGSQSRLARIVAASASQLARALPVGAPLEALGKEPLATIAALQTPVAALFALDTKTLRVDSLGFTVDGKDVRPDIVSGVGQTDDGRSFAWTAELLGEGKQALQPRALARLELISHAVAPAVFLQDAVSQGRAADAAARRPTRADAALDGFRFATGLLPNSGGPLRPVGGEFVVQWSGVPYPGVAGTVWSLGDPAELRNDDLSAAHVHVRLREFFGRLERYGLPTHEVFRHAALPLVGIPRAALPRAPDSRTVNAAVRADASLDPATLEVRFGAVELSRRSEQRRGDHLQAEPLGLAADPRWAWHEFGHVLAFAATAQLEFRFSHGVGDALAAVIADPQSQLADDPSWLGLTFPFAALTRRHDRPAHLGWCFCGQRSELRRAAGARSMRAYAGYFEEQLFSSSLFRLYRSLGGVTRGNAPSALDLAIRQSASDYVVYLIIRAIQQMPRDDSVPKTTASEFVALLEAADAEMHDFVLDASWPEHGLPRTVRRRGGRVGKVITWAFAKQGLDANVAPDSVREGEAPSPAVDLCLQARGRELGSYEAVPLRWRVSHEPWHAAEIVREGTNRLVVTVHNRGRGGNAEDVKVQAWWRSAGAGSPNWQELTATGSHELVLGPNGSHPYAFEFTEPVVEGGYWIFAAATCTQDRSNIDPATLLPFADGAPPEHLGALVELVANDNNCGLALLD